MSSKGPGKHCRKGITTKDFYRIFPNDATAEDWFIVQRWPEGVRCPYCGSDNVQRFDSHKTMSFRCRKSKKRGSCGKSFSVKTGTFMERSNIGYQDWLFAFYLMATSLKGVSSMKLHRELGKTQKTAWYLSHRIRKAWESSGGNLFVGPVEVDETYMGGRRRNMKRSKREGLTGRGTVDKIPVVGFRDRATNQISAQVVSNTTSTTLRRVIQRNTLPGARIFTDDAKAYAHLPNHEAVRHSIAEYVRGQVHTNGIESFWSMLKRAHKGTFHHLSAKHLHRYVSEFVGRHNMRPLDTLQQMAMIAKRMVGCQLRYRDLVR